MQWMHDPSQSTVDILNNIRREVSRHFRDKKKAYLRAKIEELEINSKIQNISHLYRGINDFKSGYQLRCNIVKDEKGDLVGLSYVSQSPKYFCHRQLLTTIDSVFYTVYTVGQCC